MNDNGKQGLESGTEHISQPHLLQLQDNIQINPGTQTKAEEKDNTYSI